MRSCNGRAYLRRPDRFRRPAIQPVSTDRQCARIVDVLGDDLDPLVARLGRWGQAIRHAGGYPASGPHDLARTAR